MAPAAPEYPHTARYPAPLPRHPRLSVLAFPAINPVFVPLWRTHSPLSLAPPRAQPRADSTCTQTYSPLAFAPSSLQFILAISSLHPCTHAHPISSLVGFSGAHGIPHPVNNSATTYSRPFSRHLTYGATSLPLYTRGLLPILSELLYLVRYRECATFLFLSRFPHSSSRLRQ